MTKEAMRELKDKLLKLQEIKMWLAKEAWENIPINRGHWNRIMEGENILANHYREIYQKVDKHLKKAMK